jgi:hypothetical protein
MLDYDTRLCINVASADFPVISTFSLSDISSYTIGRVETAFNSARVCTCNAVIQNYMIMGSEVLKCIGGDAHLSMK